MKCNNHSSNGMKSFIPYDECLLHFIINNGINHCFWDSVGPFSINSLISMGWPVKLQHSKHSYASSQNEIWTMTFCVNTAKLLIFLTFFQVWSKGHYRRVSISSFSPISPVHCRSYYSGNYLSLCMSPYVWADNICPDIGILAYTVWYTVYVTIIFFVEIFCVKLVYEHLQWLIFHFPTF
jgi:hypothetical protein